MPAYDIMQEVPLHEQRVADMSEWSKHRPVPKLVVHASDPGLITFTFGSSCCLDCFLLNMPRCRYAQLRHSSY